MEPDWEAYRPKLLTYFMRRGVAPDDADDLAQQLILRLMDLRAVGPRPYALVFRSARNLLTDFNRSGRHRYEAPNLGALDLEPDRVYLSPDRVYESEVIITRVREGIARLTPRERQVVSRRLFTNQSDREIAAELGIRPANVRVTFARGRKHLQTFLMDLVA